MDVKWPDPETVDPCYDVCCYKQAREGKPLYHTVLLHSHDFYYHYYIFILGTSVKCSIHFTAVHRYTV